MLVGDDQSGPEPRVARAPPGRAAPGRSSGPAHPAGPRGRSRATCVADGRLQRRAAGRASPGSGTIAHVVAVGEPGRDDAVAEARGQRSRGARRGATRAAALAGSAQPDLVRQRRDRVGERPLDQHAHKLLAAPLALPDRLGALGRVALRRERRELVDVGEDRLGERRELGRRGAGLRCRVRDPPPRDASAQRGTRPGGPRASVPGGTRPGRGSRTPPATPPESSPGCSTSSTNRLSASPTPVRTPSPKRPSRGCAYSGTESRISAITSSPSAGSAARIGGARSRADA